MLLWNGRTTLEEVHSKKQNLGHKGSLSLSGKLAEPPYESFQPSMDD